jgi:hypothetical protein
VRQTSLMFRVLRDGTLQRFGISEVASPAATGPKHRADAASQLTAVRGGKREPVNLSAELHQSQQRPH